MAAHLALKAQSGEQRIKIQLTIDHGGKKIVANLNSFSSALTRTEAEAPLKADTAKNKVIYGSGIYLNMDLSILNDDLLRVLAKKDAKFNATVTINDTYGKLPGKTILIKNASLYSLSDQHSTSVYGDGYGSTMIAINCDQLIVNGISLER
ncbi:hypothetical protein [Pedobacter sp. SYP-B3415]|uniref:hypothetical protein n=1 Tax=Pedobacter sp. SYP-B3415 TaxID=2496641 RepID=UPI00101D2774|nr:hypothetical protein [Pedobacter sp. SYP-B3415]